MKDFFGKTQEEFRAWLLKHTVEDEPTGLLAISPELYAWFEASTGRAPTENDGLEVVQMLLEPKSDKPDLPK
jgi:hypothetical protein